MVYRLGQFNEHFFNVDKTADRVLSPQYTLNRLSGETKMDEEKLNGLIGAFIVLSFQN